VTSSANREKKPSIKKEPKQNKTTKNQKKMEATIIKTNPTAIKM